MMMILLMNFKKNKKFLKLLFLLLEKLSNDRKENRKENKNSLLDSKKRVYGTTEGSEVAQSLQ